MRARGERVGGNALLGKLPSIPCPTDTACYNERRQRQHNSVPEHGTIKGSAIRQYMVNRDRIGDVPNLAIPEALIGTDQFVLDLLIDGPRDVNAARLGHPFESRGDVDAVTVNVAVLDDNVPEIDTHTILNPLRSGNLEVAIDHRLLNHNCRSDRLHRRFEGRQKSISEGLDDLPTVFSDSRSDHFPGDLPHARKRPAFVSMHQSGIADDIGGKYH